MSNRETHSLAQNVVPSLQLESQPGKAAATAGAHQTDPGFAGGATSLGIIPTLAHSGFSA